MLARIVVKINAVAPALSSTAPSHKILAKSVHGTFVSRRIFISELDVCVLSPKER